MIPIAFYITFLSSLGGMIGAIVVFRRKEITPQVCFLYAIAAMAGSIAVQRVLISQGMRYRTHTATVKALYGNSLRTEYGDLTMSDRDLLVIKEGDKVTMKCAEDTTGLWFSSCDVKEVQ